MRPHRRHVIVRPHRRHVIVRLHRRHVIVRPHRRHAKVLLRIINLYNLQMIDSLHDVQKLEFPLTVYCQNVQALRNKALSEVSYVVSQGIDVLALTEK